MADIEIQQSVTRNLDTTTFWVKVNDYGISFGTRGKGSYSGYSLNHNQIRELIAVLQKALDG